MVNPAWLHLPDRRSASPEEGCDIGVIDVDARAAEATADCVREIKRAVAVAAADVTDIDAMQRAVDALVQKLGKLDILVNSAGILRIAQLAEMSKKDWDDTLRINVDGVFHACRAAIPHLRRRKRGRIINIASWLGKTAKPYYGAYSASKFAVIALTQASDEAAYMNWAVDQRHQWALAELA